MRNRQSKPWKKRKRTYQGSSRKQKHEEYPQIDWENLEDENVQIATILYNDRVVTWKKMKQLDELLDKKPTRRAVVDMAELRIRNLLAFSELQTYNDTGMFRYKHPLIVHRSERAELNVYGRPTLWSSFAGIRTVPITFADTNPF